MIRRLRTADLGVIHYSAPGLRAAWPHLAELAAAEGLHGHAEAARLRVEEGATLHRIDREGT